jgi:hypothetical protein
MGRQTCPTTMTYPRSLLDDTSVHTLMVAALAMILSLSLFTVAALDYPFKGDVRIHPAAFEQVLERFHESKLSDL